MTQTFSYAENLRATRPLTSRRIELELKAQFAAFSGGPSVTEDEVAEYHAAGRELIRLQMRADAAYLDAARSEQVGLVGSTVHCPCGRSGTLTEGTAEFPLVIRHSKMPSDPADVSVCQFDAAYAHLPG